MIKPAIALRLAAALLACLLLAACRPDVLYADLNEQQANEVLAALLGAGIQARKRSSETVRDAWAVHVPAQDVPAAVDLLNARGLPRRHFASFGEVFEKQGFATSQVEEKARYLHALNQELAHTLSRLEGVIDARVHVALPDRDPLGATARESSAAVVILQRPGESLEDREIDIKAIVMDSVEGLDDVNKVTVKFFDGRPEPVSLAPGARPSQAGSRLASPVTLGLVALLLVAGGMLFRPAADALRRRRADADDGARGRGDAG